MRSPHVLVLGAGVAGSFAALSLASRGARVTLLERHRFAHAHGSSHGGSRIFRHAYADPAYVRLATHAGDGWSALERDTGERLLWRAGGLDLERSGGSELPAIERALREGDRPFEWLTAAEVRRRFPAFAPADDVLALYQPDAAVVAADRALAAALRLAASKGAELRFECGAVRLSQAGEAVAADLPDGERIVADGAVACAGPWLAEGDLALGLPMWIEQQQVLYLAAPPGPEHGADAMPVFIDRDTDTYGMGRLEHPAAVKVSDHSGAPRIRLAQRAASYDERRASRTRERIARILPGVSRLVAAQTCLYTKTPDADFVIGPHPTVPGTVVAGGFSGHGFKFGPALGSMLADLALEGVSGLWSPRFAVDRFEASAADADVAARRPRL